MEEGVSRRLFLPDVRGSGRYLRVTWHKESSTIVCSHWQDDVCVASTPLSLADASRMVGLIVGALKETALRAGQPEAGVSAAPVGRSPSRTGAALARLRDLFRPPLAPVLRMPERAEPERSGRSSGSAEGPASR